ncbi:MAG: hydantoinase/carbamoylase family amidase [Pseudomonadota bacterium]
MAKANAERALAELQGLRRIGAYKTGVHRPTLSKEDMVSREWLCGQLRALGHEAHVDGIANVVSAAPGDGPRILAGSHIESQNEAGWLDGALGVIYALEAARAVAEDPALSAAGCAVDVCAFADEEGHFGSFFGSKSLTGKLSEEDIDRAECRSGRGPLRDHLAAAGLADVARARLDPSRYLAFFEAHIEQGPRLEAEGLTVGVVTSIVAIWQYRIVAVGEQNHAGATSMTARKDAAKALLEVWRRLEDAFPGVAGPDSVWTAGRVVLDPNAPSVIPGYGELWFQHRDCELEVLERMHARLEEVIAEADAASPCAIRLEIVGRNIPARMDEGLRGHLAEAAEAIVPGRWRHMPSAGAHDAQMIQPHLPSAMLFVPSIGGVSHHWTEDTDAADIKRGVEVYVDAVSRRFHAALA